ncbi:MAG TPA: ZIP family metal transporter [Flavobacteriales bacterium]|jgi:zinc transporter ZupT|nr:ZIP family metal transporter [Flavobacteriales bacterium]
MIYAILFLVVMLGGFIAIKLEDKTADWVKLLLSFSGAYLLSIIVFHLLPGVYKNLPGKTAGLFIMLGIVFQLILELFSHGAEHGHKHRIEKQAFWLTFLSLSIHAFMEGLPINEGHHLHESYFYGILIHKLPVAIVLTTLLLQSGMKKSLVFVYLTAFAAMSPLAAFLGDYFDFMAVYGKYINAFVVGILAHIGTTILFETEHSHQFNIRKFALIFLAMFIAYLT